MCGKRSNFQDLKAAAVGRGFFYAVGAGFLGWKMMAVSKVTRRARGASQERLVRAMAAGRNRVGVMILAKGRARKLARAVRVPRKALRLRSFFEGA